MKNLLAVIYDAWPVLITALLFSWISGMTIWLLVCYICTGVEGGCGVLLVSGRIVPYSTVSVLNSKLDTTD